MLELVEARVGSHQDFNDEASIIYTGAELKVVESPDSTVWFRLPERLGRNDDLVEVRFLTTTYSTSTSFRAFGQDSSTPGWQRVDAGDATELVNSQSTSVLALAGNRFILDMAIESPVMTPNGDDQNDRTVFNFAVARISAEQMVSVSVYDLSGTMVAQIIEERDDPRGVYSLSWTGHDAHGDLVAPGIYIARVEVESQSESTASTAVQRLVHVAY